MSTRSLGSLTLDVIAKTGNLKSGMSNAARDVENESRKMRQSLSENVTGGVNDATAALNQFSRNIISIAAAWKGFTSSVSAADAYSNIQAKVRLATDGVGDLGDSMDRVREISLRTYQGFDETASLVQKASMALRNYGLDSEKAFSTALGLTELFNKGLIISGANTAAASAGAMQFSQALASGRFQGDEFRTVMETNSRFAQLLADKLGVTITELREMSAAGKLSTTTFLELADSTDALDDDFSKIPLTVERAIKNVRTNMTAFIGDLNNATGAVGGLANGIAVLGSNISGVAAGFAGLASSQISKALVTRITAFKETNAALVTQAKLEVSAAQAIELKTRRALLDTQAEVVRARAIGGSVSISAQAAAATLAHRQALIALEQAQLRAAAAANIFGRAAKGALAFFGGPVGLALMVATTAASWLIFRDNTERAQQSLIDFNGTMDASIEKFADLNRAQQAGEILRLQDEIAKGNKEIAESISLMSSEGDFTDMFDTFGPALKGLEDQWKQGKITADEFSDSVSRIGDRLVETGQIEEVQRRGLVEYASNVATSAREVERKNQILDVFVGKQNAAASATDGASQAIRDQASALQAGQKALSDYIGKLDQTINQGVVSLVKKTKGEFAALQVEVGQTINAAGGVDALDPKQRAAINDFLAIRKKQIAAEKSYDDALKQSRESKKGAAKEVRDADRLAKAMEGMTRAQRDWNTELSGTGNPIMDDFARKLDDIKDKAEQFARVGVPQEKIAAFTSEMERLALAIKDKDLADFAREFDWSTKEMGLSLAGTSAAAIQYERALFDLNKQLKSNLITQEQYDERLSEIQGERHAAATTLLQDLAFELELMGKGNAERETAIQLRGMDSESIAKYGDEIAEANRKILDSAKQVEMMDDLRGEFKGFFSDVIQGNKSIVESFKDMLANISSMIADRIAQNWVDQLFGEPGTNGSGTSGGGWLGAFASLFGSSGGGGGESAGSLMDLFGGAWGFANGGNTKPWSVSEVNERGFEMASVNGRDYLLTGAQSVAITPNHRLGGGQSLSVTQVFNNPVMADRRSDSQRQLQAGRELRVATRNA